MTLAFRILFAVAFATLCNIDATPVFAQSVTTLTNVDGKYELTRNGKPFRVDGVGGSSQLSMLASYGGNSIRTWSTDGLDELLDQALEHDLSVCVGMWLGHPRHGFDYQDEPSVTKQLNDCLQAVRKYKDHPAVLMWAVGNEMEGEGRNPAIWYAINHIARQIKRIDPNHPTMTVIAELGEDECKLHNIQRFCPDIDIVGVNSYGGISTVAQRYKKSGLDKPYIVTEHGPIGPWETQKTSWGSPIEVSSTEKGKSYASGYHLAVNESPGRCLGSFAFLWGHKQETTATWFGMLLPDGSRLAAVDAMSEAWTGSPPKNRCPEIKSLQIDANENLQPGQKITATLQASDPENDKLKIDWVLRQDSVMIGTGGDFQADQETFADAITSGGTTAVIKLPDSGGPFRVFAYVRDGQGGAAVANVAFNVPLSVAKNSDAKIGADPNTTAMMPNQPLPGNALPQTPLPLIVYGDSGKNPYAPSGYMGNTNAITMQLDCTDNPRSGATCLKIDYTANDQWGGVLWQSPANDWDGTQPGGLNLTGAAALEFYVRGNAGGETVSFVLGVIEDDTPFRDSSKAELANVKLTDQWQKMRIPLEGRDLSRIKTGFGWSLAGQSKPVTFYVDEVQYVGK